MKSDCRILAATYVKSIQRFICFTFLFTAFLMNRCYAQKENNIWYFGELCGLDFNSGSPVVLTNGQTFQIEGVASVSDSAGNILFYTDGIHVLNRNHNNMPNGNGLKGGFSSTHSATIAPHPGNPNQYYIFTCPELGLSPDSLRYSIVDMTLAGGLGDVTVKNFALLPRASEKCVTVLKPGTSDRWMVNRDIDSTFYAWLITPTGINPPVTSVVPLVNGAYSQLGYLKSSPSGTKLADAPYANNVYILYDFDQATGIVSNPVNIMEPDNVYGIEFSPDGTKLYGYSWVANAALSTTVNQFDISSGNAAAIMASKTAVGVINHGGVGCAQIGPDNKIYITVNNQFFLAVINYPDSAGIACGFVANGIYLAGESSRIGLPAIVKWPNPNMSAPAVSFSASDSSFCGKQCIDFTDLSTNNPTSWQWFFPGADSTSSNMQNPFGICYSSYGTFDVTLIACNAAGCDTMTVTALINEFQNPPVPVVTMNVDTLFSTPAYTYQWYFNSALIPGATDQYYVFQQMGTYFVIVTDSNGCASSSSSIMLTTGINVIDNVSVSVYPNPSDGSIVLSGAQLNSEIKIYDVAGRVVYADKVSSQEMYMQLKVNDGIYFLQINDEKNIIRKKILISK